MNLFAPILRYFQNATRLGLAGSAMLLSSSTYAATLVSDSFATTVDGAGGTYSTAVSGSRLWGQEPTAYNSGFTGAWGNANNLATSNLKVGTSGLTHALLQGTAQAGSIYTADNNSPRTVSRALSSSVTSAMASEEAASGEIWFSALTSLSESRTGGPSFGLGTNLNHDAAPSTGFQIFSGSGQIRLMNGATQLGTSFTQTVGLTYLIAVRIDFTAGGIGNDSVDLEIYSPTDTFGNPTATISASGLTISTSDLAYLNYYSGATSSYTSDSTTPLLDEFRLGLTRADVMAVPEPSSAVLLGLGGIALMWRRRKSR